jgi:hypothetical protein
MPAGIRPNVLLQEGIAMVKEAAVACLKGECRPQVLVIPLVLRPRLRIGADMGLAGSHHIRLARQPSAWRNPSDKATRANANLVFEVGVESSIRTAQKALARQQGLKEGGRRVAMTARTTRSV